MTENYKSVGDRWREVIWPKPSIIVSKFSLLDLFGFTSAIAVILWIIVSIHLTAALLLIPMLGALYSTRFTHRVRGLFPGLAAGMLMLFFAFIAVWPLLAVTVQESFATFRPLINMIAAAMILGASVAAGFIGAKVFYH